MDRWIIAYDISHDRRRAKVASCLENFGVRVQESVFEAILSNADLDELLARLRVLIEPDADSVRAYPLCAACAEKVRVVGLQPSEPFARPTFWVV